MRINSKIPDDEWSRIKSLPSFDHTSLAKNPDLKSCLLDVGNATGITLSFEEWRGIHNMVGVSLQENTV